MLFLRRAPLVVSLTVAIGCSAPAIHHPDIGVEIPEQWTGLSASPDPVIDDWIASFGDANLEAAVVEAIQYNHDLRAAAARLAAAAANTRIVGADRLPRVSAGFDASRQRLNFVGLPIPGFEEDVLSTTFSVFGVSLDTQWELDVWGRIRAGYTATLADMEAVQADFSAARRSLAAQTAKAWFAVAEAKLQVGLAQRTLESYRVTADQVRSRFERGLRPSLDLRLALSNVAMAEAFLNDWQERYERSIRQLETLLGRYPDGMIAGAETLPDVPFLVPAGLPAEILSRRPDLAAAERRLAAADARIAQARAALFPRISLTTGTGTLSDQLRDLVDADFYVWSIAGNLLQPIFEGGRLVAEVDRTEAVAREALEHYTTAALQAFNEVESALVAEGLLAKREEALAMAADQAVAAHELAEDRYRAGLENFISVLDAQRRELDTESQRIAVRRLRLDVRVNLHLALGGDVVTVNASEASAS